jgi:hypothetical protein
MLFITDFRALYSAGLHQWRGCDCSRYWKEPRRPEPDVRVFVHAWRAGPR